MSDKARLKCMQNAKIQHRQDGTVSALRYGHFEEGRFKLCTDFDFLVYAYMISNNI